MDINTVLNMNLSWVQKKLAILWVREKEGFDALVSFQQSKGKSLYNNQKATIGNHAADGIG